MYTRRTCHKDTQEIKITKKQKLRFHLKLYNVVIIFIFPESLIKKQAKACKKGVVVKCAG